MPEVFRKVIQKINLDVSICIVALLRKRECGRIAPPIGHLDSHYVHVALSNTIDCDGLSTTLSKESARKMSTVSDKLLIPDSH